MSSGWYEVTSSELVYEGYSKVHRDTVQMPDGSEAVREVVRHDDAVAVVPLFEDGSVILLRQYRHPFGTYVLEIPAGKLDVAGEDPAAAAQRELVEEIGYRAGKLERLTTIRNSAGWTDEETTIYLGRELQEAPVPMDFEPKAEEADMEILRLPLAIALEEVVAGKLGDAQTVVGLLLADRVVSGA